MNNIWKKLSKNSHGCSLRGERKPFFILAPMAGVTDSPFRQMVAKIGKPDLMFTEFVSTEMVFREIVGVGLAPARKKGRPSGSPLQKNPPILRFDKKERPLIVQFFGCKPEQFRICAKLAVQLGFDGIDINMGCPDKKVQKQGSGSELIKDPKLAKEIIRATIEGCDKKLPVSIKVRLGYEKEDILGYLKILKDIVAREDITTITIHGRTAKQGYGGEADWKMIGRFARELKLIKPELIIVGNGDVKSLEQGRVLAEKYGVDGVMIGREILRNPWVFCSILINHKLERIDTNNIKGRLKLCLEHTRLFQKHYDKKANIGAMKKYYKAYLPGTGVKKDLMECRSLGEAKKSLMSNIKY